MSILDAQWNRVYDSGKDFKPLFPGDLDRILGILPSDHKKQHLDIGCGTGGLTRDLYHRGYHSTGIDPSASAIKQARAATIYIGKDIDYICTSLENADLASETYSLITCKLVYAFFDDKNKSIEKIYDLLSPGGHFVLITKIHNSKETESPISVYKNEVLDVLNQYFGDIHEIDLEWATCFVCQAK